MFFHSQEWEHAYQFVGKSVFEHWVVLLVLGNGV